MKLVILATALLLSGCGVEMRTVGICHKLCDSNGGPEVVYVFPQRECWCKNGAQFRGVDFTKHIR